MGPHLPNEIITIANIGADKGQKKWMLWGRSGLLNSGQNVQHFFKKILTRIPKINLTNVQYKY